MGYNPFILTFQFYDELSNFWWILLQRLTFTNYNNSHKRQRIKKKKNMRIKRNEWHLWRPVTASHESQNFLILWTTHMHILANHPFTDLCKLPKCRSLQTNHMRSSFLTTLYVASCEMWCLCISLSFTESDHTYHHEVVPQLLGSPCFSAECSLESLFPANGSV